MRSFVAPGRVVGLDVARAVALVAMMATHILPDLERGDVSLSHQLAAGRASALFAVLAGVSIALMTGRTTPHRGRQRLATSAGLAVRALIITAVGLFLTGADHDIAVILHYYGLLFLLALPFIGLRARPLLALAAAWSVVVPALSHLARPHLPEPALGAPPVGDPLLLLSELTLTGYYPALPWLTYLFVGMAVGRLDLARARTSLTLVVVGAWLAVMSWAASAALVDRPEVRRALLENYEGPGSNLLLEVTLDRGFYGTTPTGTWWWLAVDTPHTATPFDLAHTIGTSLVAIGLAVLGARVLPQVWGVLFGAGTMTLTLYSAHVIARSDGWWDGDDAETYLGQVVAVLVVGAVYALTRARGPLERVVVAVQQATVRAVSRAEAPPSPR